MNSITNEKQQQNSTPILAEKKNVLVYNIQQSEYQEYTMRKSYPWKEQSDYPNFEISSSRLDFHPQ